MGCWCGHQPWHYCRGYHYPPNDAYEGCDEPPRRRRRAQDEDRLTEYLTELADEVKEMRRELAELRGNAGKR